jgi:hypothetical protein
MVRRSSITVFILHFYPGPKKSMKSRTDALRPTTYMFCDIMGPEQPFKPRNMKLKKTRVMASKVGATSRSKYTLEYLKARFRNTQACLKGQRSRCVYLPIMTRWPSTRPLMNSSKLSTRDGGVQCIIYIFNRVQNCYHTL